MNALEKQGRRVRFIASLALLLLFAMLSLVSSYVVFRRTIKAQEFVVKDAQGSVRGTLGLNGLTITGSDGTSNIRLVASADGDALLMTDADGKGRIYLSADEKKTAMLSLVAEGGSADVQVSPIGREVDLQDEFGGSQATLESMKHGSSLTLGCCSGAKEQGIMTTNGIAFWDTKGKVIYAAGK
ncbi:MAG: hypothetical protein ABSD64_11490 [Terriglobales bacterium]